MFAQLSLPAPHAHRDSLLQLAPPARPDSTHTPLLPSTAVPAASSTIAISAALPPIALSVPSGSPYLYATAAHWAT